MLLLTFICEPHGFVNYVSREPSLHQSKRVPSSEPSQKNSSILYTEKTKAAEINWNIVFRAAGIANWQWKTSLDSEQNTRTVILKFCLFLFVRSELLTKFDNQRSSTFLVQNSEHHMIVYCTHSATRSSHYWLGNISAIMRRFVNCFKCRRDNGGMLRSNFLNLLKL